AACHVAPGSTPYLRGGDEDDADERKGWTVRIPLEQIDRSVRGISVAARTPSGRARTLRLETSSGSRALAAVDLRQQLGYRRLPSLLFSVEVDSGAAVFRGRGSGHGVGLCQWRARIRPHDRSSAFLPCRPSASTTGTAKPKLIIASRPGTTRRTRPAAITSAPGIPVAMSAPIREPATAQASAGPRALPSTTGTSAAWASAIPRKSTVKDSAVASATEKIAVRSAGGFFFSGAGPRSCRRSVVVRSAALSEGGSVLSALLAAVAKRIAPEAMRFAGKSARPAVSTSGAKRGLNSASGR